MVLFFIIRCFCVPDLFTFSTLLSLNFIFNFYDWSIITKSNFNLVMLLHSIFLKAYTYYLFFRFSFQFLYWLNYFYEILFISVLSCVFSYIWFFYIFFWTIQEFFFFYIFFFFIYSTAVHFSRDTVFFFFLLMQLLDFGDHTTSFFKFVGGVDTSVLTLVNLIIFLVQPNLILTYLVIFTAYVRPVASYHRPKPLV